MPLRFELAKIWYIGLVRLLFQKENGGDKQGRLISKRRKDKRKIAGRRRDSFRDSFNCGVI